MDRIRRRLSPEMCALVDIMRMTGYRVNDILSSRVYQWSHGYVTLYEHKTGKQRTVDIDEELASAISRYKRAAWRRDKIDDQPLAYFVQGKRGRDGDRAKRHRSTIYRKFARAVRLAGLDGNGYTIHSLRKCYAVDLYNRSESLLTVQRDLNHDNLATTCLYVFGSRAAL